MATDTNSITISGNITRDPEMRYTPSGVSKVTFGVAVNRSWRNQQTQEWEEQTSFFNVVAWRQLAENVGASLTKGSRVVVSGRLEQRSWETEQGEKRSIVEIVADDVAPSLRFATAEIHKVERSGRFWAIAHFSKHVRRGAKVFQTDGLGDSAEKASKGKVSHVGFSNPDGSHVVVLANTGQQTRTQLVLGTSALELELAADSVYTLQWS